MTRARDLSKIVNNKMTVFKYTATASQTTFTGADDNSATLSYNPNSIIVTYNGIVLENVSEYTATNGTSIVLATGATVGSEVNIIAFEDLAISGVMPTTGGTFSGDVTFGSDVTTSGKVGVGTNSPTADLTVAGSTTIANDQGYFAANLTEASNQMMALRITPTRDAVTKGITLGSMGTVGTQTGLQAYDTSDNSANKFAINPFGGNVGVNVSDPLAPLHVEAPDNSELMAFTVTGQERWALRGESGSGSNDFLGLGISGGVQAMYWNEGGAVRMPSNPCAVWGNNSGSDIQLHGHGGWYDIPLTHAVFNIGGHYNTSNYRFTAPVTGIYHVWFSGEFTSPSQTVWSYLAPRINGSATANLSNKGNYFADFRLPANAYQQFCQNWYLNLAEGDWFKFSSNGSGGSILAKSSSELLFGARLMQ